MYDSVVTGLSLHHLLLCIFKALRNVVNGLVLSNGIFLKARLGRIELANFRLIRHAILQFAERREQAGSISLAFSVLAAQSVLHREPIALHGPQED